MKVTNRQLSLLVKEALSPDAYTVLTESELNEIGPVIAAMARGLGSTASKAFAGIAKKGAKSMAQYMGNNPKVAKNIAALIAKSKDKLPGVKKFVDEMLGGQLDPAQVAAAMGTMPKDVEADMNKMIQAAGKDMEKGADCECPDPKEQQSVMGKLGALFK